MTATQTPGRQSVRCTFTPLVKMVRAILKDGNRRLDAIRYVRSKGFTFPTARTMVREIGENARWYRCYR